MVSDGKEEKTIGEIFGFSPLVRYVALYRDGRLTSRSRAQGEGSSSAESDRYEELLVNPTLLKLAGQRGDIDCGGLDYLLIRYGNFFQFVKPMPWGHVSACLEPDPGAPAVAAGLNSMLV